MICIQDINAENIDHPGTIGFTEGNKESNPVKLDSGLFKFTAETYFASMDFTVFILN